MSTSKVVTTSLTASSSTAVTIPANPRRGLGRFVNTAGTTAYVKLGTGATSTSYWASVASGASVDLPLMANRTGVQSMYKGVVTIIWAATASGSALYHEG